MRGACLPHLSVTRAENPLFEEHGWPGRPLLGEVAAEAAAAGEDTPAHAAILDAKIAFFQARAASGTEAASSASAATR